MMIDASPTRISIPDSLLTVATVEDAVAIHCEIGIKTVLLHAPTPEGGCTCGKVHDKSAGGSTSIGKHPILPNWQKRESSFDQLRDQISRLRFTPNVGIVLGKQPGGDDYLIAVDVDDAERFAEARGRTGSLPETPRCDSGRGYRLFFSAHPETDVSLLKNRRRLRRQTWSRCQSRKRTSGRRPFATRERQAIHVDRSWTHRDAASSLDSSATQ